MMNHIDDDDDSLDQFAAMFAARKAAAPKAVERRKQAERKANRTVAERAARRPLLRSEQMNFRATPETRALHNKLAAKLECSMADIYDRAIHELAKREAVSVEGA
jgi:hypothetical protein